MMKTKQDGFTLIEVILALMIFAVVAVLATIGLRHIIKNSKHLKAAQKKISVLLLADTIIKNDLQQILHRSASDDTTSKPAINVNLGEFYFAAANNPNPLDTNKRSDILLVDYNCSGALTRTLTDPITRRPTITQPLLSGVSDCTWKLIDNEGRRLTYWPPKDVSTAFILPRAVVLEFNLAGFGHIERIYPIEVSYQR